MSEAVGENLPPRAPEAPNHREKPPTIESTVKISETQSVIAAEDIALTREEITQKIIKENIPAEKWVDTAKKVLEKYPQLEIYRKYFLTATENSQEINRLVNQLWETIIQDKTESPEDESYKRSDFKEVNGEVSKTLFKKTFGKDAKGDVKAVKGRLCLIFEVTRPDLNNLGYRMQSSAGSFMYTTEAGVPAAVVLSDPDNKDMFLVHEIQHLHNKILKSATDYLTFETFPMDLPKELQKTRKRNLREESDPHMKAQSAAKNEILSYATYAELIEAYNVYSKEQNIPFDSSEVDKSMGEHWKSVEKELTGTGGLYYEEYNKEFGLKDPYVLYDYKEKVSAAINAYIRLTKIYKEAFPDKTNRIAINVLAQFPLDKWPTVVHLIETRRISR